MNSRLSPRLNTPLALSTVTDTAPHFTYDPAGNIASRQVETSGTAATMTTYSHNSLNELTAIGGSGGAMPVIVRGDTNEPATVEVKSGAAGSAWKDARMLSGNRFESDLDLATGANAIDIRATDGSNNVANHTYSLTLAAASAASPAYDDDGNMTSDGVRGYEWDRMSRLVKVTWGGSPAKSTEYRYNALGQRSERIEKSGGTETAHYYYLYEGIRLLCRYQGGTAAANIDRQYLTQGEQRKISSAWSSYYYNRDHLGSVREVMNADGSLAARYDYTPYGVRRVQYQSTAYTGGCDLGFTGHVTQPSPVPGQTELVLTHFRGYDPELGRWLSADPMGAISPYDYCFGNPLGFYDPDGAWPKWMLTPGEAARALWDGGFATQDGMIPFFDPYAAMGFYNPQRAGMDVSKTCGKIATAAGASAMVAAPFATNLGYTWSGVTVEAANAGAARIGAQTLEMTNGGRVVGVVNEAIARWVPWGVRKWTLWAPSSALYAASMRRLGGSNIQAMGDIYKYIEKPILTFCRKL